MQLVTLAMFCAVRFGALGPKAAGHQKLTRFERALGQAFSNFRL